jgi:signal transduction histidine kinase
MSTNILLLSKLENQGIVTDKTEFRLDEQLRACLVVLEKQWSAKELELDLELEAVNYRFNEDILSHLWLNLFGNAIKFTPAGGTISCSLRADGQSVTVVISDTGIGMDEETRHHIFDKFYQGDTSHAGDGNGIGLNIVSRILYLSKGSITVESQVGVGSTFTVRLPLRSD